MTRPDYSQLRRQQRAIGRYVGETATWRRFHSASAGSPALGVGDEPAYVERRITGLFVPVTFEEVGQAGGQFVAGDMRATLLDCQPGSQDEVVWSGTVYRVASDAMPQMLVGRSAWRVLLRRGGSYTFSPSEPLGGFSPGFDAGFD